MYISFSLYIYIYIYICIHTCISPGEAYPPAHERCALPRGAAAQHGPVPRCLRFDYRVSIYIYIYIYISVTVIGIGIVVVVVV